MYIKLCLKQHMKKNSWCCKDGLVTLWPHEYFIVTSYSFEYFTASWRQNFSYHKEGKWAPLIWPILATLLVCFVFNLVAFAKLNLFLEKIVMIFNLTKLLRIPSQLVYFWKEIPGLANWIKKLTWGLGFLVLDGVGCSIGSVVCSG